MKNPREVEGLISAPAGELLRRLAAQVPSGQVIVEIGAYLGRSTCYLASGARAGVPVLSIDPHGLAGSERGRGGRFAGDEVRERYLANIAGYDAVVPIRALGKDAPLPDLPVGLLWVDGDHSLAAVREDVRRFAPLVASGGYIALDDYMTWHPGVNEVVARLMRSKAWKEWRLRPVPLAWARRA